jgi:predicted RNA binding protein YcfA (HicA-like mRNA interferase family)
MPSSTARWPSTKANWFPRAERLSKLPVVSGKKLIKILTKHFGFRVLRQRGSHVTMTNEVSFITVPMHPELDPGTLKAILNDAVISREEFLKYA